MGFEAEVPSSSHWHAARKAARLHAWASYRGLKFRIGSIFKGFRALGLGIIGAGLQACKVGA